MLSVVLVEAVEVLEDEVTEAVELVGVLVEVADAVGVTTEIVLVAVGVVVPQFHQPPEAVTVTVSVSSTTLVTIYLLSNKGLAKATEPRRVITRLMTFIVNWAMGKSILYFVCAVGHTSSARLAHVE